MVSIIRNFIGSIMLFFSWIFSPKGIERDKQVQLEIDRQTSKLKLYQFMACPFCIKVRRALKRMSLNIEMRDAMHNQEYRQELETQGGRVIVPCLRIEHEDGKVQWMYESSDIIEYLKNRFQEYAL